MGDFSAQFHRPDPGVFTVEGNVAGSRAGRLAQERQRQQDDYEQRKQAIVQTSVSKYSALSLDIDDKFVSSNTSAKIETNTNCFGKETGTTVVDTTNVVTKTTLAAAKKTQKQAWKEKRKRMATLSFCEEIDDEESARIDDETTTSSNDNKRLCKDPSIDTSFLPDKHRDEQIRIEHEQLQQQWYARQEQIKMEQLEIVYSYWDGSGHRRSVVVKKGDSIYSFLEKVRDDLAKEFRELQSLAADALIFVKEDLIIPQDMTFYDLIAIQARGKSGPLFHFDVHDDVRVGAIDTRIEKDESHPGKVVERRWYERNKHIFPASRWEVFDVAKDYGGYTIGDKNKRKK